MSARTVALGGLILSVVLVLAIVVIVVTGHDVPTPLFTALGVSAGGGAAALVPTTPQSP